MSRGSVQVWLWSHTYIDKNMLVQQRLPSHEQLLPHLEQLVSKQLLQTITNDKINSAAVALFIFFSLLTFFSSKSRIMQTTYVKTRPVCCFLRYYIIIAIGIDEWFKYIYVYIEYQVVSKKPQDRPTKRKSIRVSSVFIANTPSISVGRDFYKLLNI